MTSCLEAIKNGACKTPDKPCIIDQNGTTTYLEYWKKIVSSAEDFRRRGIKDGAPVVLIAQQEADYLACFHGVQLAGGVPMPLERTTKEARVAEFVKETGAALVVAKKPFKEIDALLYENVGFSIEADVAAFAMPAADAVAEILFTTGTTGKEKGVVMNHGADVAVAENVMYGVKMQPDNVEIIPMPLNHSFALRRYYANLICGATVILLNGVLFIQKVFDAFEKQGATAMAMNPAALAIIFKLTKDIFIKYRDQIRYLQFGSAHLPDEDKKCLREMLPGTPLYDIYGSTEAGCACILDFGNDRREKCVGKPACNANFRVIDMDGNVIDSDPEHPGRLTCSGGMCMREYFNDPATTAETMIDGYVYSNDLSYIDEDGYIYLLGRCDDVISSGGNKIAPQDVEDAANMYDGITDCACIGVPDEVLGSVAKLFIVPAPNYDEKELFALLNTKLEYYMIPKSVEKIAEIPKTFNGKILRRQLRDLNK